MGDQLENRFFEEDVVEQVLYGSDDCAFDDTLSYVASRYKELADDIGGPVLKFLLWQFKDTPTMTNLILKYSDLGQILGNLLREFEEQRSTYIQIKETYLAKCSAWEKLTPEERVALNMTKPIEPKSVQRVRNKVENFRGGKKDGEG